MTLPSVVASDQAVHWRLVRARGADTRTFLQGQLSCDVTSLATGECVEGLVLAPSGDVVTSLGCREHPEGIDLVMRAEVLDNTLGALRRFLLRTQCVLEVANETAGPYATVGEQVRQGAPGPAEFALGLAAHSFGRAFVASHVSFTKGCFTGQELVGRLDARGGNVPFRLARITGEDEVEMDQLARSAGPQGERAIQGLTTAVRDQVVTALAVVHRTLMGEETDLTFDGVRVELLHGEETLGR
jgi:folate-binding Fe-S cluster repair protein YgfZ